MDVNNGTLKVHYDGRGTMLKQHQMRARSVSKSLLAIETLYTEAFREVNKIYNTQVNTEVLLEGGFQEGSLWWLVKIFEKKSKSQTSFENHSSFSKISIALNKVVEILKCIKIENSEIVIKETKEGYEIEVEGKPVILDEVECAILTNEKVRASLSDLAMPLTDDGIDTLLIENQRHPQTSISIDAEDKANLLIRRKHKFIIDEGITSGFYYVESLSYNPKSKWKFISVNDHAVKFSATITDTAFLKRVSDNTEKFSKDDELEIVATWYKEKSKLTGNTSTIHTIIEVKNHLPVEDRQGKLL